MPQTLAMVPRSTTHVQLTVRAARGGQRAAGWQVVSFSPALGAQGAAGSWGGFHLSQARCRGALSSGKRGPQPGLWSARSEGQGREDVGSVCRETLGDGQTDQR